MGNRLSAGIGANTYGYGYAGTSNRLLTVSGPSPLSYAYDAAGNLATNGKHIFVHDARGRLSRVISVSTGALLAQYQINALGQRVHKLPASGTGRVFLYDTAGRLIGEARPTGQPLWDHIWLGDLPVAWISVDQDEDGVPDESDNCISVANPNQRDVEGDGIGEMCDGDINGDGRVDLDDSQLIQKCVVRLIPCKPKYDVDGDGRPSATDALRVALRAGLPAGPSGLRGEAPDAQMFYVYPDHLGTPRVIIDTHNRVRWRWDNTDPFGANIASEDPDGDRLNLSYPLRFPGQYFDKETGLHYNYFRDYDPQTGRYIQSDPIGLAGGLNTYAYVDGNPGRIDPLGLDWIDSIASWWSGSVAAFQADSASDTVLRTLQALPSTALVLAGLGLISRLSASQRCVTTEATIVANSLRGRAVEARVLEELGLVKNTKIVSTAEGRSIPDALTDSLSVEIKDALNVSLTRQLRIQTEAARLRDDSRS